MIEIFNEVRGWGTFGVFLIAAWRMDRRITILETVLLKGTKK